MSSTPPPYTGSQEAPRSSQATTILVIGIIGLICCQIAGPIAWYMGRQELNRIEAGMISRLDEGTTKAGMILGIISTVLLILGILWVFLFGGLAFLSALLSGAGA